MISVRNLFYKYEDNEKLALNDISFDIKDGSFSAIIGETGSGKSTLILNLNGLIRPTSGEVSAYDYLISKKGKIKNIKDLRKKIGIVFQFSEYQLFEETVEKDILFGPKNFGMNVSHEMAINALKLVGLDESYCDLSPFDLSGGEKRKVAIAGILAFDSDTIILDEPTAGLDPKSQIEILELLKSLNEKGKTIILVTHLMDHVLKYCDNLLVLNHGHLDYAGDPYDFFIDDNLLAQSSLECPDIIKLVKKLGKKYPQLLENKIHSLDEFIIEYRKLK